MWGVHVLTASVLRHIWVHTSLQGRRGSRTAATCWLVWLSKWRWLALSDTRLIVTNQVLIPLWHVQVRLLQHVPVAHLNGLVKILPIHVPLWLVLLSMLHRLQTVDRIRHFLELAVHLAQLLVLPFFIAHRLQSFLVQSLYLIWQNDVLLSYVLKLLTGSLQF